MRRWWAVVLLALAAASAEHVFELTLDHGKLRADLDPIRVHQGDTVVLRWHTDRTVMLHLHGYDIETRASPGTTAETRFEARAAGRYPIDVHGAGGGEAVLLYLEVYPD